MIGDVMMTIEIWFPKVVFPWIWINAN